MYTTLQKLAISIYSLITPLHHTIERLTVVKSKNGWQRHVGYFTPNTGSLFPPALICVQPTQPIQKDWIFIDIAKPWTIRRCQEVAEEIGHPYHVIQDGIRRITFTGIRVPEFILDLVTIQARSTSFVAKIAIIHRADSIRLARIRLQMRHLYPEMPASRAELIVRRMPGVRRRRDTLFYARNIDLDLVVNKAVEAHVRHNYTEYERLMANGMDITKARKRIGDIVDSKLKMWRRSTHLSTEKVVQAQTAAVGAAAGGTDRKKLSRHHRRRKKRTRLSERSPDGL